MKALVVDDDSIVATDIAIALKNFGCAVVNVCASGQEAIEAILKYRPTVVVMDVKLKGTIDGIEVIERIEATYPNLPVIFITARQKEVSDWLATKRPNHRVTIISKPFKNEDLEAAFSAAKKRAPRSGKKIS